MAFLYNKTISKLLLSVIIIWGVLSFWFSGFALNVSLYITILGVLAIILVILETAPIYILLFLSFTTSFALYIFLFQYNLPMWIIMITILIVFGYFFYYTEQRIGILGNKRLVYLVLFSLITLEVFFTLNYFLISPLSKSLIISIISYLFIGFCYSVLAKHNDSKLSVYLVLAAILTALVLLSSVWGNVI